MFVKVVYDAFLGFGIRGSGIVLFLVLILSNVVVSVFVSCMFGSGGLSSRVESGGSVIVCMIVCLALQ